MRLALLAALVAATASAQETAPHVTLGGDLQVDARAVWGETDASTFLARRARFRIEAAPGGPFRARLLADVAGGQLALLDAYAEARLAPGVAVRVGKFKAPVGLERLRAPTDLDLPERSFVTALVPNRDLGVLLRLTPGRQSVELALTNGAADGASVDVDPDAAKDVTGRLFVRPVRGGLFDGLAVGLAASAGAARGTDAAPLLSPYATSGRDVFYRPRPEAVADGARARVAPQLLWLAGPASLLAEAAASRQRVRLGDAVEALDHRAWNVTASVVLTGEAATYGRLRPARPLGSEPGAWGAVAVAARVHRLALDADAFPTFADPAVSARAETAAGVAVNWSPTDAARLQLSAERAVFTAAPGATARPAETLVLGRLQLAY